MTREIDLSERQAPARAAASAAHDAAMQRIRATLGSYHVPREAQWWTNLKPAERATLVRHAGLNSDCTKRRWESLGVEERQRILQAVERAAAWARKLQSLI